MEDSFVEYRDNTGADSESDSEVIDNSLVVDVPYSAKKKNQTAFVAESEESTDDENDEGSKINLSKSVVRRSSVAGAHVISSSDEDASRKGSIRRHTKSDENVVLSSSDDDGLSDDNDKSSGNDDSTSGEEVSPELVPKRRPPIRPKSIDPNNDSIIGRKTKKRMFLLDSDTENDSSIVIEQKKHNKIKCLQDTPLKIDNKNVAKNVDKSMDYDDDDDSGEDDDVSDDDDESDNEPISKYQSVNKSDVAKPSNSNQNSFTKELDHDYFSKNDGSKKNDSKNDDDSEVDNDSKDDEEGPDEDLMVMSRATRMSIMGVMPKDDESDDSDYIQSDDSSRKSKDSVINSLSDLPDAGMSIHKTPEKEYEGNSSKLTCSPFSSPLHDITNELNKSTLNDYIEAIDQSKKLHTSHSIEPKIYKKSLNRSSTGSENLKPKLNQSIDRSNVIDLSNIEYIPPKESGRNYDDDDDVRIIDSKPEIIALSSDDDEVTEKSPKKSLKKSPKPKQEASSKREDIKKYMMPESAPNQVMYVKKNVREYELDKLNRLKEDLSSVRMLLDEMDLDALPDGGSKLIERLTGLEAEVRKQGDRVANMIVEPDQPTAQDIARDGFDKGLSWEDIQKANNAVQPRMFGKQAMATHMAERNLIIDRLRDLHSSIESRPSESTLAPVPRLLSSKLMKHQQHALAWLQWRETQRPAAGILADDMGLGKTITMISLVASDKEGKIDHDEEDDEDRDGPPAKGKLIRGGTLVVCPASLIQQWASEVRKHCTAHALSVCLHHGNNRATQPHRLSTHDMVATTYNILQRDSEKNGVLMRVQWRRAILDEAHIVRNHKAATSAAVCALRSRRRWCLTGTPVQNKDLDLFALLKFLRVSPFDELRMWKKWIDNKSQGGQERLATVMQSILLRRTKAQLQERGELTCLPSRTAHHTEVTLTPHEMNVYQKVLVLSKSLFAQFLHQRAEKNADSGTSFAAKQQDSEYFKMHKRMMALQGVKPVKSHEILVLLLRLRQVCCHCGLIAAMLDEETAAAPPDGASEDLLKELDKLSLHETSSRAQNKKHDEAEEDIEPEACASATEAIRAVLSPNNPVFELNRPSSKINAVMDVLNNNVFSNKGDKAVVVSQWTSVLRLVEAELSTRRVRSVTLSGNVPVPARPALIDALNDPNSNVKVMLLSLCAGGVGINLCGANHLLLLDPHWNPQLEEQAQDRIYRVGQKKDVHIYRFMCVGTVEQTIRKLQEAKLTLAENVLTGARNIAASTLSIEDLKMLFNY